MSLPVNTYLLTKDQAYPDDKVYWTDLILTAIIGWVALVRGGLWDILAGLAFYRGLMFLHEIPHIPETELWRQPYRVIWNIIFGIPLLIPSFMLEYTHHHHHDPKTYATKNDPEYATIGLSKSLYGRFLVLILLLEPIKRLIRFLILGPISLGCPPLHRKLMINWSTIKMNYSWKWAGWERNEESIKDWTYLFFLVWFIGFMIFGWRMLERWIVVAYIVNFLNLGRVLVMHDYRVTDTKLSRNGQRRDSIDHPGELWSELWAPVGHRFHSLHHYYPHIPYHELNAAYNRLVDLLPPDEAEDFLESTSLSWGSSMERLNKGQV